MDLRGLRPDIINATIKSSYLWSHVRQFQLTQNMRLNPEAIQFRDILLQIGNGTYPTETIDGIPDYIAIPPHMWIPLSIPNLFERIYDDFANNYTNNLYIQERAILSPLNSYTDDINDFASERAAGEFKMYNSNDLIIDDNQNNNLYFSTEYLNSLDFSGIPPHQLMLKINIPVILLRNISNHKGLCNGTRLMVKGIFTKPNQIKLFLVIILII